ncbi:PREDICTED: uncharacterized protein LOC108973811 [Bactrocera latifrons]|uniref:Fibrous sheath-interacting protein 2 n=1 Tax=Bactrocera latifrons TaxID=174628 RepID=A0A0K8USJ8_BACLA|nr:PREDICTED: uncharacterized protein LOC108973811 [Bactrocera latifrons]
MIDILSLSRRPKLDVVEVPNLTFKSGLPINSLPGWELIPLNSKLPMLKCPGNQVIFSKNKIGQSFKHLKQEFDPSVRESLPEYNPLHDSNLKTFYANERNLKRLRENGEITQNNDVICNLKDFNEYRQQLHKTRLYYVLQELNRQENEQHDRMLINNAEAITARDHHNLAARQNSFTEIQGRKRKLENIRATRYQKMWQRTQDKIARKAAADEMGKAYHEYRKLLNHMKMQRHLEAAADLQRKHLIKLKKVFQFKQDRLQKNQRHLQEERLRQSEIIQTHFWEKRLKERIAYQDKIKVLLEKVAAQRQQFIENHRQKYDEKWLHIQNEIKERARKIKKQSKLHQHRKKKPKPITQPKPNLENGMAYCDTPNESVDKLLDFKLCEALNAAIDMEDQPAMPFDADDPIYKAAKFIITHIIKKFDKDLSKDPKICKNVRERVDQFFDEAKRFVLFRSSQIIASIREQVEDENATGSRRPTLVSFSRLPLTIGESSYAIHPMVDIKPVDVRTPTPVGSLASIKVQSEENMFSNIPNLCRNELIFIEHYIIKFKRELIVGVGKRVFSAIDYHFSKKIMDVRPELLNLNRNFLTCEMSKAILSYATNKLNYESSIKLCISALASDIIWSLQKHLLKPERDPRGIVQPKPCTESPSPHMRLCLYCHKR